MIATITGIDDPHISMKGRLANLSAHGLSLIIPRELPSGISVLVEWAESHVRGRLVYCQPYRNEYRAGLQVDDPIYDTPHARNDEKNTNPHNVKTPGE